MVRYIYKKEDFNVIIWSKFLKKWIKNRRIEFFINIIFSLIFLTGQWTKWAWKKFFLAIFAFLYVKNIVNHNVKVVKIVFFNIFFLNRNLRQKLHILNVFKKIRFSNSKNLPKFLKNESKLGGLIFFKIFFYLNMNRATF